MTRRPPTAGPSALVRRAALIAGLALSGVLAAVAAAAGLPQDQMPQGQPPPPATGAIAPGSPGDPVCGPVAARPGPPRCAPAFTGPANAALAAVVRCETGGTGDPHTITGGFEGLYQFSPATWRSVGGRGHPAQASVGEQHYRAWLLWLRQGLTPWPVCARAARTAATAAAR